MCGICGQFNFGSGAPVTLPGVQQMTETLVHRGPDDEGYHIAGPLGLGFRRLSIIDLGGGHQPMSDAAQTVWVIFNGEIYNFRELRQELESWGHRFRTRSDTEVIVHGYKQWGTDVFDRLNGMFGVAIWDTARQRLVLARDAMGIKLVYYAIQDGKVWFGSEMRPVVSGLGRPPDVDPVAVNLFLRYRYTPSPLTIFKGIEKLAPGTMMIFEGGRARRERWYRYAPAPFATPKRDDEAYHELLELYRAAVGRHLISDVPVGILLSGGLDSGLLLALMNEHGSRWPAYTVGYGESYEDDELGDASETALLLGARHIPVRLDQAEFEQSLPGIVASLEEPIAASSIVPMYFVCRRARQDVKVALIGQGPDELFGGYKRHLGVRYGDYWRRLPGSVRHVLGSAIAQLPRNETLKRGVVSLGVDDRLRRYQHVFSLRPSEAVDGLFHEGVLPAAAGDRVLDYWSELLPQMEQTDELGGLQLLEVRSSLPDELLMYADKLSMAHGLEVRVPYLDRTVVEYVQRLEAGLKVRRGSRKWLHRQICRELLPWPILKRKKRGFAVNVVDDWLRSSLSGKLSDLLLDPGSRMFSVLKPEPVRALLDEHRSQRQDNHKLLFSLVLFEQWLRSGGSERPGKVAHA
ncbi:MAG TPA: asparagine synthase (glutamine-hydrolyzing) [Candidatus Methylomirabilis sp.]|nr:asparagine synthase (glutamine-hydrolyzing) [Candidatus Methylomirabilis sp.]